MFGRRFQRVFSLRIHRVSNLRGKQDLSKLEIPEGPGRVRPTWKRSLNLERGQTIS